jgi:hypothetical protein
MGTRALVHIVEKDMDNNQNVLVSIYTQYDGYLEGLGMKIKNILDNGKAEIINGYGNNKIPSSFNGIGCMAAYLIGSLKGNEIGNVYIVSPGTEDVGEEYTYFISELDGKIHMTVYDGFPATKELFNGLLSKFNFTR